ncbi:MAG: hypothetical protein ACK5HY_10280 [Parahaliea sp.]
MKRLTAITMAVLLASGSTAALADRNHRGDSHGRQHYSHSHHGNHHQKRHHDFRRDRHYSSHYSHSRHYSPYHRRNHFDPLGAALIGTAIGLSINHNHHSTVRYYNDRNQVISGCYRIERYADGSERRVDLPPSECR